MSELEQPWGKPSVREPEILEVNSRSAQTPQIEEPVLFAFSSRLGKPEKNPLQILNSLQPVVCLLIFVPQCTMLS